VSKVQAVIYAAKSSEDRHGSIPTQLEDARGKCEREGWEVVGEFSDEGFSAYSGNRGPELELALTAAGKSAATSGEIVVFVVQHSDRISRGAGLKPNDPKALIEIWHEQRRLNVHLRSVQDDDDLRSSSSVANLGERNHMDSKRKGDATADGHKRTVRDGAWRGGILPAGYEVRRSIDARGRIEREVVKHPEDEPVYALLWQLALDDASEQHIALELNRRGYRTRPVRAGQNRVPFSAGRVSQILNNAFYAGMQPLNGELSPGRWPTYVDFEDWQRLRTERRDRGSATKRKRGRPPEGYLLSELAKCECGKAMQGRSTYTRKKDGVRSRAYVCVAHREHHERDENFCPAMPLDADAVDRLVVSGIEHLLGDADALRDQLRSGQTAERDKLAAAVASAGNSATIADRSAERATAEFARAEDDAERALLKDAAKASRAEAARARKLADAALDALSSLDATERDPAEQTALLWESIGSDIAKAGGDVKTLNAVLRETFERFTIGLADDGRIVVKPRLRPEAVSKHADPSGAVRIIEPGHTWTAAPQGDGDEGSVLLVGPIT
jgi:DNA invertase Pin-like site-specific DNA recombinase